MKLKGKQLIALLGSVSLLLTSCSGNIAYAEAETEGDILVEAPAAETETVPMEEDTAPATEGDWAEEKGSDVSEEETSEGASDEETETTSPESEGAGEGSAGEAETESSPQAETNPGAQPSSKQPQTETEGTPDTGITDVSPQMDAPSAGTEKAVETEKLTEKESETETAATEMETSGEGEPVTEVISEMEEITEEETETLTEEETEPLTEEETEWLSEEYDFSAGAGDGGYYWDESWFISPDFRFTQVDKQCALIGASGGTFVYEENDDASQKVGEIPYSGVVCILKELGDGWVYVESGDIRGFVKEDTLRKGEAADDLIDAVGEQALTQGDLLCEKADNEAFTYTKTTSYPVLARKVYAMSLTTTWIYEYPDMTSRFVGDAPNGSLLYVLKDLSNGWCFVESGDVRGFIPESVLLLGGGAEGIVSDLGEESVPLAEQLMEPEENRSVYYTLLSVKSAGSSVGSDICQSAVSFVGKLPYVYGGTSLSSGADCSGFVQSIFAGFGISLPRTAQEQGANGQAVLSLSDAQPGDVIYYASGPHVGIYLGNGKVVQCSGREYNTYANPGKGPTISRADYMPITSIRRYIILRDETTADGGYRTDDTPYTKEQLEIIWAVVAQEDNGSYDGALAVISSAMNRTESSRWSYEGSNAFAQLTAAGQYCYSMDRYWVPRLNGNVPDYVKQAVDDCLNRGIRNHNYTSFRSTRGKTTGADAVQIGGNWYFGT